MLPRRAAPFLFSAMFVVACGGSNAPDAIAVTPSAAAAPQAECVQLAPGSYFWDGSRFVAAPMTDGLSDPDFAPNSADALRSQFAGLGLPWLGYSVMGRVAILTGAAPDLRARDRGFEAGAALLREAMPRSDLLIADAIRAGSVAGPAEGLVTLAASGTSVRTCQDAFNRIMQGRAIQFASDQARISPASATLLDALAGASDLCMPLAIEIGGHTDFAGSDDHNLKLSQERAEAVRAYLISKGIDGRRLTARGFGESQPLDPSETQAARAKNRRTEFKVIDRR